MKRFLIAVLMSLFLVSGCASSVTGAATYVGAGAGAGPPKSDVRDAVETFLEDSGVPSAEHQDWVDCITDDIYVTMSTSGLETLIADGVDGKVSDADYSAMEDAINTCTGS